MLYVCSLAYLLLTTLLCMAPAMTRSKSHWQGWNRGNKDRQQVINSSDTDGRQCFSRPLTIERVTDAQQLNGGHQRQASFKKKKKQTNNKSTGVTAVRIWDHTWQRKAWLASITHSFDKKNWITQAFFPYLICHSSVLYNHTHAQTQTGTTHSGSSHMGEKWKTSRRRKKQNPGLREICHTHYAHHRNTHKKKGVHIVTPQCPILEPPPLSWMSGGRSMSATSTCTISFVKSSTENGMLQSQIKAI